MAESECEDCAVLRQMLKEAWEKMRVLRESIIRMEVKNDKD